ncbi:hypothetical protein ACWJJH_04100 [Endozoicomonadaceae bacterium StTr2]
MLYVSSLTEGFKPEVTTAPAEGHIRADGIICFFLFDPAGSKAETYARIDKSFGLIKALDASFDDNSAMMFFANTLSLPWLYHREAQALGATVEVPSLLSRTAETIADELVPCSGSMAELQQLLPPGLYRYIRMTALIRGTLPIANEQVTVSGIDDDSFEVLG